MLMILEIHNNDVIYVKDYNEVISDVDIVILTLPLLKETKHIVNSHFIEKLKYGVSLINLSRGKLIKEDDLIKSLKQNKFFRSSIRCFLMKNH